VGGAPSWRGLGLGPGCRVSVRVRFLKTPSGATAGAYRIYKITLIYPF